jgi:hypothetical protein
MDMITTFQIPGACPRFLFLSNLFSYWYYRYFTKNTLAFCHPLFAGEHFFLKGSYFFNRKPTTVNREWIFIALNKTSGAARATRKVRPFRREQIYENRGCVKPF